MLLTNWQNSAELRSVIINEEHQEVLKVKEEENIALHSWTVDQI